MTPGRHLAVALAVLAGLTAVGTAGYTLLGGMGPFEALYMTAITLSTVGFDEVYPLGTAGRVFTLALIAGGVGATLYAISAMAELLITGSIRDLLGRRAMKRTLETLRDHVIVCGYGRLGRAVVEELERAEVPFVVVDENSSLEARLEGRGFLYVIGSAVEDTVLETAGVLRARALVAATGSEAINVFVTLAAREANPTIVIHARAGTDAGVRRLRLAGASQVVSPYHLGGQRIANAIVRPAVVDFIELVAPGTGAEIDLEEVVLDADCALSDRPLRELQDRGLKVSVVAIKRGSEAIRINPGAAESLRAGDRVVVVGDRESLHRLAGLAVREASVAQGRGD